MQFRDGQLLTAEDINKYLVNREGALDTSAQTEQNTEYANEIQTAQTRLDKISGTVINFPGYSTNIVEIPLTYYQSPTHAGNATGTEGWKEIHDAIKASTQYFWHENDDLDIVKFRIDKSTTKLLESLVVGTSKVCQSKLMQLDSITTPNDSSGWKVYESPDYVYYKYKDYSYDFPIGAKNVFYTPVPLSTNATVFDFYAFGTYAQDNLPLLLAEVTA